MKAIVEPGNIEGIATVPMSKSMMQRYLAAALLHRGTTYVHTWGKLSNDEEAALNMIRKAGAQVDDTYPTYTITSNGIAPCTDTVSCGESGLAARMFIPVLALSDKPVTITGSGSLLARPMDVITNLLPKLGVTVTCNNSLLPMNITGPMQPADITIDGSLSSQFLTGLLFAYAFSVTKRTTITVYNLNSRPYIDITLQVLNRFGADIENEDYRQFYVYPRKATGNIINVEPEPDWSSAAPLLIAGAIGGKATIFNNLDHASLQADRAVMDVLQMAGAEIEISGNLTHVSKPVELKAFNFDAIHYPDLFPVLSVLAGVCAGESTIKGISRLLHKESNRLESITDMLERFGVFYSVEEDSLVIEGRDKFEYAVIDSHNDHRIVMAAAIGALRAKGPVTINGAEAVSKSFPSFFRTLTTLGINYQLVN